MRLLVSLAAIGFLVMCGYAYLQVGLTGFDNVLAEPWGLVTLLDVSLGAVCMSAVIFHYEKQWPVAAALGAIDFSARTSCQCGLDCFAICASESG